VWGTLSRTRDQFSPFFLIIFRQLRVFLYGAPSLTRSRVCSFQFLLVIASAAVLRSESHGTHEHILFSLFLKSKSKSHYDRQSVGQFVLVSCPSWSRLPDVTFIWVTTTFFILHVGCPLWRENGSVTCIAMTQVQFQVKMRPTVSRPVRLCARSPNGAHNHVLISLFDSYFVCSAFNYF
jgi:hypothetical protein